MKTAILRDDGTVTIHPETKHPQIGEWLYRHQPQLNDAKIGWVFIHGGIQRCMLLEDGTLTLGTIPITVRVTGRCLTGTGGNKLAANITDITSGQIFKCHLQIGDITRV
jgi:hypothetical protein